MYATLVNDDIYVAHTIGYHVLSHTINVGPHLYRTHHINVQPLPMAWDHVVGMTQANTKEIMREGRKKKKKVGLRGHGRK